MRFRIIVGPLLLLLGIAACGIDTGDPGGEGADTAESATAARTRTSPTQPTATSTASGERTAEPSRPPSQPGTPPADRPTQQAPEETSGSPEPAPTGLPGPPQEQAESDPVGTYTNPVPAGTTFVLSAPIDRQAEPVALWEITLDPTDTDATDQVLAENEFNEIAEGRRAVMTAVTATYVGPQTGNAWLDLSFTYLGSDGNTFALAESDYCGVVPNDLDDYGEQFPGASVTGNVCKAVPEDVIDGGMWIVALHLSLDDQRVFVSTD